jgi:acyl dehydratase
MIVPHQPDGGRRLAVYCRRPSCPSLLVREELVAGRYFEDLEVGDRIRHARSRTVTEADNVLFCSLTQNTQPLHLDEEFAARSPFGRRIVNGIYTLGLAVGLSVPDLSEGTIVANLSYDKVSHPKPVFHGDTLTVETEVLEKRPSKSKPDRGIVRLRQKGTNQKGEVVIDLERTVLFLRRPPAEGPAAPGPGAGRPAADRAPARGGPAGGAEAVRRRG